MRTVTSFAVVLLLISVANLQAQESPSIQSGARVRVSASGEAYRGLIGTVSGYDSWSIGIKPDNEQSSVWVPLNSVTRLQQSRGQKSNTRKGALIGLLAGGAVGAVVGAFAYEECQEVGFMACFMSPGSAGETAALGGLAGGLLGAGIGALIGASSKTDRWEEVPLDRLRVSFAPRRDGFAFGMRVAF